MTVLALILMLLFTDICFLIATQIYKFKISCKVFSVLLHWGSLTAQLWIAVIAFDILLNFKSTKMALQKTPKQFCYYCYMVYSTATIFIAISIALDVTGHYNIGYGQNNFCFIKSFLS